LSDVTESRSFFFEVLTRQWLRAVTHRTGELATDGRLDEIESPPLHVVSRSGSAAIGSMQTGSYPLIKREPFAVVMSPDAERLTANPKNIDPPSPA
jgi:hypothetical protein